MKVFGYVINSTELSELNEVTLQASSEELKRLSDFFLSCAEAMEKDESWEHEHFKDFTNTDNNEPELIVAAVE